MEEVKEWLRKAEKDWDDAKFNLEGNRLEVSAFLAQQAAEKALKALHVFKFKRLWRIHDLVRLGKKVDAPKRILKLCDGLNPHYIRTRYPIKTEYTREESLEAVKSAEEVMKWARDRMLS